MVVLITSDDSGANDKEENDNGDGHDDVDDNKDANDEDDDCKFNHIFWLQDIKI